MKDSDQSKFVRWGIPGWIMFLAFFGFIFIDIVFTKDSSSNKIILFVPKFLEITGLTTSLSTAVVGFVIAAAGIPLGFCIYQLYFYVRWTSPISRFGLRPTFIMGREEEINNTLNGLSIEKLLDHLKLPISCLNNSEEDVSYLHKWRLIDFIFMLNQDIINKDKTNNLIFDRYKYLFDLFHTQGAALFGIYLGYFAYLIVIAKIGAAPLFITSIVSSAVVLSLLYAIENQPILQKSRFCLFRWLNLRTRIVDPSIILVTSLFSFLLLLDPLLSPNIIPYISWIIKILILLVIIIIYSDAIKNNSFWDRVQNILLFAFSSCLLISVIMLISNVSPGQLTWNYGWATFAFTISNIIMLKNRKNTRDDLTFIQNIVLRMIVNNKNQISGIQLASTME